MEQIVILKCPFDQVQSEISELYSSFSSKIQQI